MLRTIEQQLIRLEAVVLHIIRLMGLMQTQLQWLYMQELVTPSFLSQPLTASFKLIHLKYPQQQMIQMVLII